MYHRIAAQHLARRIYKLKQKLERHMAQYYGYMHDMSRHVGRDPKEDDYYINRIMRL